MSQALGVTTFHGPTQALRMASRELLRAELLKALVHYDREAKRLGRDDRDVMLDLAPYHDCARRLGLDPAAFFEEVADAGPPRFRDLVRGFGRREDITPAAFGYRLVETSDGPSYVVRAD